MEEDIRNLKEIIELCEEEINNNDENVTAILDLEDLKSLRNLIKANKDLEEENKTLNERNQYLVKYRAKLEKKLYESNENYIPVSLVEEKIEELNKQLEEDLQDERKVNSNRFIIICQCKNCLQELLEKR